VDNEKEGIIMHFIPREEGLTGKIE